MDQNDKSKKFQNIAIVVVLVIIITGIVVYFFELFAAEKIVVPKWLVRPMNTPSEQQTLQPAKWKTYRNDELGIMFNYPAEWSVTVDKYLDWGVDVLPCKKIESEAPHPPAPRQPPLPIYTASISFGNSPIFIEFLLLDLNIPSIPKIVCLGTTGDSVNLTDSLNWLPAEEVTLMTNKAGIKFETRQDFYYSDWTYRSIYGPVYQTHHNNMVVYITSSYEPLGNSPEAYEMDEKYIRPCENFNPDDAKKGCGPVAWMRTEATAEKIRQAFHDLEELIWTFNFTK